MLKPVFSRACRGLLAFAAGTLLVSATASAALPDTVQQLLRKHGIAESEVSVIVSKASHNGSPPSSVLLSHNAGAPRNPASVLKLLTTMAALELLGPTYQWETRYLIDGKLENGTLQGNLVLQGGGDPFLTVDRLWSHVLALRERGIRDIAGNLIIDNTLFNIPAHDRAAFDGKASRLYNVGPDAALTNFSATRFVIEPVADNIRVFADPPLANLVIENRLQAEPGKCVNRNAGWSLDINRQQGKIVAAFDGSYRPRCSIHSISRSITSNTEYTYQLFRYLWESMGGSLSGGYGIARVPETARPVVTLPSRSLAENISSINKFSNNVMARQLLLTIGVASQTDPAVDTRQAGVQAVREWMEQSGVSSSGLIIDNGSGLSRDARLSARQIDALLQLAWNSTWQPEFLSSLSLVALDGTMRKRLRKSRLKGRARIKTGLIRGVRSMAGYVHASDGQHYLVTMIIDSGKVNFWNGNQVQDALLEWVYAR